jgi:hypothetical protein
MGINVKESLAAQGLDESDLAANQAGRVSEKQLARQVAVRSWGTGGVWTMALCFVVGAVGFGAWRWVQYGQTGLAIFMSILGLVMAALPLGILYAFRFADPKKVGACKVTLLENAEVGVFLPSSSRGIYAISLNHQRYSGFANRLMRAHFGSRVNAYVVPEHRIVLALEPRD